MNLITPPVLLAVLLATTLLALVIEALCAGGRHRRLRRLAQQWGMNYVEQDRFDIAARLGPIFPVIGAAEIRIRDVMYVQQGERQRYLFTVDFTAGVVLKQRRLRRVATFCEPRDGGGACSPVRLAEHGGRVIDQYEELKSAGRDDASPANRGALGQQPQ